MTSTGFSVRYTRSLRFTTDEGTWMSVDVSPDGRTIAFDLLGDLYLLPIGGGRATRITHGPAFDAQPRFSPDGRSLVFVSDRGGVDALWVVDADGQHTRQFVRGAHLSPVWSPDGRCIAASKRETATGGERGSADVMLYCRGREQGVKLGAGIGVAFSPDGHSVYFSAPSAWREGSDLPLTVYDRRHGRTSSIMAGPRPAISPDGTRLVFAVPYEGSSALKIRTLATGAERWLTLGLGPLNGVDPSRDARPGYAFTPDGTALVIAIGTKLWRIEIASGARTLIPFTAEVHQSLGKLMRFPGAYADSASLRARRIRQARLSPDGRRLAFVALDKIWLQDLPGGTPCRLTTGVDDEYAPTWSPDGRYVAYATWSPNGGHIYRISARARDARPEQLTRTPAYFDRVTYAHDGRRLLALRGLAMARRQVLAGVAPADSEWVEVVWLPAAGGEPTAIAPMMRPISSAFVGQPFTTRDTSRVYFTDTKAGLVSTRWDGSDRQVVATGTADDMVLSPDGRLLAVLAGEAIAVVPAPGPGEPPRIDAAAPTSRSGPTRVLPRQGADAVAWTHDGRTLVYAGGSAWYRYEAARADSLMRDSLGRTGTFATESQPPSSPMADLPELLRHDVEVTLARDVAPGTIVLRGARLITMAGDEVIERGDLVITNGRIAAAGTDLPVPDGAHVVDVSGKTILPGYIDLWTTFRLVPGVHATQPWEFLAHLAYGVTTVREPSSGAPDALDFVERVEAGTMLGPRYLVAGTIDAPFTPDRRARQTMLLEARASRQNLFAAGALEWALPLVMAQDGFPVYVRNVPITPLGNDVVQLLARSGSVYVPGLVQNDAAPWPIDRYIADGRYHDDPKLARLIPHPILDDATLQRARWVPDERYQFPSYAADAARIVAAGGRVAVATRGAFPGLGVHWELWALHADGRGLSAHDALRAGTIAGAEALGVAADLGSLEPGKLADLQVVDGNPLEDIRHTTALSYVMKSGRLYEAATLAEVWPRRRVLPTPWWVEHDPVRPMTELSLLPPVIRN